MALNTRRLLVFASLLVSSEGCSGGDGGRDAEGPATVNVRDVIGEPVPGVQLESVHSSAILDVTETDADGSATLIVRNHSRVTAHYVDPGDGTRRSWTLDQVFPGDAVSIPTLDLFQEELGPETINVTVDSEAVPGVSFVQATATYCNGFDARSVPMGVTTAHLAVFGWPSCRQRDGLYSFWAVGDDFVADRTYFASVFDLSSGMEPVLVLSSDTATRAVATTISNLPADIGPIPLEGLSMQLRGSHASRPVGLPSVFDIPPGGGEWSESLDLPPSSGSSAAGLDAFAQWTTQGGRQWFFATTADSSALDLNAGLIPLPPTHELDDDDGELRVAWDGTAGNLAIVRIEDGASVWTLFVDPRDLATRLPPVPEERSDFIPMAGISTATVAIVRISFVEDFRDFVSLDEGPLPEPSSISGGSSGVIFDVLRR